MAQFEGVAPRSTGLTNGRETLAYALAQAIKIALADAVGFSGLLSPLYAWVVHAAAGRGQVGVAVIAVSTVINVLWTILALVVFLVFRGLFSGTPANVGGPGREQTVTTRGAEIGAFALAYAIVVAVLTVVNTAFLSQIYVSLYRSGEKLAGFGLGLATSIVSATLVYALFVGLRRAFLGTGR
jgi:hypothetical protein